MAKRKRTAAQISFDLVEIEALSLKGKNHYEIADELSKNRDYSLSRQQIQYDIRKLKKLWAREAALEIGTAKAIVGGKYHW